MIETITSADDALVAAVARLMPQLNTAAPPSASELASMLAQPGCTMLIARDGAEVAGMLVLTIYRTPTGVQARIDDVVVDAAIRGKGIGEALTRAAIERARQAGAKNVSLTSRPSRDAANRLYVRLGFQRVDTNVYRYPLQDASPVRA